MKERPILFSAPMVRAILAGTKTQTRRVVKFNIAGNAALGGKSWHIDDPNAVLACPYGQPGDRLWVRETWGVVSHAWNEEGGRVPWTPDRPAISVRELPFGRGYYTGHVIYAADGAFEWAGDDDGGGEPRSAWKPSIHLPRAASRITLELTDVRAERLQDISEADAQAEGVDRDTEPCDHTRRSCADVGCLGPTHRAAFGDLWMQINGADSWDANPWVWVVSFSRA